MLAHQGGELLVGDLAGTVGIDQDGRGLGHTDGVADLHRAALGQAGSHDVLGHVAGGVGSRAVDLGRILAGEGATAVRCGTAVGVDDDLAAGQAAVTLRATDDEAAGGVDQVLDVTLDQVGRQHRLDDFLDDRLFQVLLGDVGVVLGGLHDGVDGVRAAVDVAQRDLRLGVGTQPGQAAVTAQAGLALDDAVRVVDGSRHQDRGLVAGVAEHQALVAGALVEVVVLGTVDALGDVGALFVVGNLDRAALVVDAVFGVVVADARDGVTGHADVVDVGLGGDFTGQQHQTGGAQGFGSHARLGVLGQQGVQDGVGDLVGDLVGVTFGDGLGGEEVFAHDGGFPARIWIGPWVRNGRQVLQPVVFPALPASWEAATL